MAGYLGQLHLTALSLTLLALKWSKHPTESLSAQSFPVDEVPRAGLRVDLITAKEERDASSDHKEA